MNQGVKTILYPVRDVDAAKAIYTALAGAPPFTDAPYYVGFKVEGQDLGLVPNGQAAGMEGMNGALAYWHVDDINATIEQLTSAGAQPGQPVTDVGGGTLIATVKDADGNIIALRQP